MPAIVRARAPNERIVAPERIALALRPELDRSAIPNRVSLGQGAPPFAGELREEQSSPRYTTALPNGQSMTLVTLRRPWLYIGFIVNPGNAAANGLVAQLRVFSGRLNGLSDTFAIAATGVGQAFRNITVGATCELVVHNGTGQPVKNLQAAIWGMGER